MFLIVYLKNSLLITDTQSNYYVDAVEKADSVLEHLMLSSLAFSSSPRDYQAISKRNYSIANTQCVGLQ